MSSAFDKTKLDLGVGQNTLGLNKAERLTLRVLLRYSDLNGFLNVQLRQIRMWIAQDFNVSYGQDTSSSLAITKLSSLGLIESRHRGQSKDYQIKLDRLQFALQTHRIPPVVKASVVESDTEEDAPVPQPTQPPAPVRRRPVMLVDVHSFLENPEFKKKITSVLLEDSEFRKTVLSIVRESLTS